MADLGGAGEDGLTGVFRLRRPPEGFIFARAPKAPENEKARLKAALSIVIELKIARLLFQV
jgi:hypothetical protein